MTDKTFYIQVFKSKNSSDHVVDFTLSAASASAAESAAKRKYPGMAVYVSQVRNDDNASRLDAAIARATRMDEALARRDAFWDQNPKEALEELKKRLKEAESKEDVPRAEYLRRDITIVERRLEQVKRDIAAMKKS